MAITVDSSQWTGQRDETPLAVPVVWGEFSDEAARDAAAVQLREAGARDSAGKPAAQEGGVAPPKRAVNEDQVDPPDEHPKAADQRNQRQLHVGTAMAATSMAAAGLVIATGGAALPAFAAAVAAGAATAAVGEPLADATAPQSSQRETEAHDPPARLHGPVLGLQAPDPETRARAERLLREAGARRIHVQETRAG
ncbi:hypothetical protein [Roseomonas sp. AR75]|uniref:hypothetical protein n=1 Tax=Roseomonas sp. AR75 TaxID=2562311 RepID=UPI0010C08CDC|nr:hypothetical protein [Roseomonas sp. AR75]